jgi:hypothetical protein
MHALRQDLLPPSGVEFAASLRLTPSTLECLPLPPQSTTRHEFAARVLCNVVVARSNILRIFEVREEPAPIPAHIDDEQERTIGVRRGTEPFEGEVEMDQQGEGFVNVGPVKVTPYLLLANTYASNRFHIFLYARVEVEMTDRLFIAICKEWHSKSHCHPILLLTRTPSARHGDGIGGSQDFILN